MIRMFYDLSYECSRLTTEKYSTSFSSAIRLLHKDMHVPVYNIYGFVRFADEIVDSFHGHNKKELLSEFRAQTFEAIERGISLNPILNSFQATVNQFNIENELIVSFFNSMEMDLCEITYNRTRYDDYIYGSAEVVGLMCLRVFCESDDSLFHELKPAAKSLGSAFQKVNFLRDVKADYEQLNRTYFPGVDFRNFTPDLKIQIEKEITEDFKKAYEGILNLPDKARFGVYVAYKYYLSLFKKIKRYEASRLLRNRIRIPNYSKAFILFRAGLRSQLNIL